MKKSFPTKRVDGIIALFDVNKYSSVMEIKQMLQQYKNQLSNNAQLEQQQQTEGEEPSENNTHSTTTSSQSAAVVLMIGNKIDSGEDSPPSSNYSIEAKVSSR